MKLRRDHIQLRTCTLRHSFARCSIRIAYEFDVFGDFACDLAVGEQASGSYCFIEFEDAQQNSIFEKSGKKATREWSRRFDQRLPLR